MATAVFHSKIGETEAIEVQPGQAIRDILRAHGIPANGVITLLNGRIVSENLAVLRPGDFVEFRQVRHYDLNVTRNPRRRVLSASNPLYTKSVLMDEEGDVECLQEQLDEKGLERYIEQAFVESILRAELIPPGGRFVTGLSGGRDSVAFLKLLERTRDRLPPHSSVAVTITGLPDWEEPATFGAARAACAQLGIEHVIVEADSIQELFRLKRPYSETMDEILKSEHRPLSMVISHHVLRRMIEMEAAKRDIKRVALGLNADDLVSMMVTWLTSGFRLGPIPLRTVGNFEYAYPLYHITKKELTLYLEVAAPDLNRQGAPGRFTTGPGERSLSYAITDHLFDLWPGIDYYVFEAFANMQRYIIPAAYRSCSICKGAFLHIEGVEDPGLTCDVCRIFAQQQLSLVE